MVISLSGIAQAILLMDRMVLMVQQHVKRGGIVWNFPGGGIEEGETTEQACIREMKEETGIEVQIVKKLHEHAGKYTFLTVMTGGQLRLDKENAANEDLVDVAWVDLDDAERFDSVTKPILALIATT